MSEYSTLFRESAELDIQRAQDWYALNALDQVDRFIDDLGVAVAAIRRSPHAFRPLRGDARRVALKTFPYLLWYRCHDELSIVEFIALVHQRQDPAGFNPRLS